MTAMLRRVEGLPIAVLDNLLTEESSAFIYMWISKLPCPVWSMRGQIRQTSPIKANLRVACIPTILSLAYEGEST